MAEQQPEEERALEQVEADLDVDVKDAAQAIAFYEQAFGAKELFRLMPPDGRVGHAELQLGGSVIMLADEFPDFGALSPVSIGGTPVSFRIAVDDVDAVLKRAVSAGATLLRPVKDEFYGDRTGMVSDPFGHKWQVATVKEVVSPEEMQRWLNAQFA